jgi:hypothetical protein
MGVTRGFRGPTHASICITPSSSLHMSDTRFKVATVRVMVEWGVMVRVFT